MADLFGHSDVKDTSAKRRDRALKKVADNSGDWMGLAMISVRALRNLPGAIPESEFTVETLKSWIISMCGKPHHHNAWGALMRKALSDKIITDTGRVTKSVALKSHARKISIYEWGVG